MKQWIFFLAMVFCVNGQLSAQKQKEILSNLNEQIMYINDGIHGLLLAHIVFENYNKDLNRYVDLEVDTTNIIFTNSIIDSKNLFKDLNNYPENKITPVMRYEGLMKDKFTSPTTKTYLQKSMKQLEEINNMRFVIEDYINQNDLNDRANVYGAYELLEKCVTLFDDYYLSIQKHYEEIRKIYDAQNIKVGNHEKLYYRFAKIQKSNKAILDAIRAKTDFGFEALVQNLAKEYGKLQTHISENASTHPEYASLSKNPFLYPKIKSSIDYALQFYETADVPERRKLYGKFYYYYNDKMLHCFNRYSNGYIPEMNNLIDKYKMDGLYMMNMPRYYKVIYPKVLDTVNSIVASDPVIDMIPRKLKNRKIKESSHTIVTSSKEFTINLYDFKIQDGDIVSINFNGDWILEEHSIETTPKELVLSLNDEGKNYLLLHAINEGRRPPNTMGIKYTEGDEVKEITMRSDLDTSELIEIQYNPK